MHDDELSTWHSRWIQKYKRSFMDGLEPIIIKTRSLEDIRRDAVNFARKVHLPIEDELRLTMAEREARRNEAEGYPYDVALWKSYWEKVRKEQTKGRKILAEMVVKVPAPIENIDINFTIPQPERSNTMRLNSSQIAVLATICTPIASQDDLVKYLNVPNRELMIKALEEEQAKIQQNAAKEAALTIIELSKKVNQAKEELVDDIRGYRQRIDNAKKRLDDLDNLIAYGSETGNYLPLVVATEGASSVSNHVKDRSLMSVPEGWTPATKAAPKKK